MFLVFWQKQMEYIKQRTEFNCDKRCSDKENLLLVLFKYKKALFHLHINN